MDKKIIFRKQAIAVFLTCILAIQGSGRVLAQENTIDSSVNIETLNITLKEALDIAMSENLTVKVADQEITRQKYGKKGTYADLFPKIDASGTFQRTLEKQTMYMDGMEGMSGGIKVGRDNNWSLGFSASMPLVDVALWKSLQISGQDVELAIEKARSSRIEMADQIRQAFYTVLLAEESVEVYKEAYENAVQNYTDIERKYKEGILAEYDLIRANVNVKNAEPNVYNAENSLILANWQLKALLGLDLNMNIVCVGSLSDYEDSMSPSFSENSFNLTDNSDLRQLEIQYNQLEKTRQMQQAAYYPTLSTSFSYQWNAMNNDFKFKNYNWDPYSVFGLTLSVPIFSGGKRLNTVKQTRTSMNQLTLQRLNTERNLTVTARQSSDQMNTSLKQYIAARAGVEEAEKGYTITMERYNTGEGTLLEINDSQLSLTQARLNLNQSIYNYLVALSALDKTLGTIY